MKQDRHHHFIPQVLRKYVQDLPEWSVERSLRYMDQQEINKAVLSVPFVPGFETAAEAYDFCRSVNRELAETIASYPERFSGFIAIPFPYVEECCRIIESDLSLPGMEGIILFSNCKGVYPSSVDHAELFKKLNDYKAHVFLHPAQAPLPEGMDISAVISSVEESNEVGRLAAFLLSEDAFENYDGISWTLGHGGGAFFFLMDRVGMLAYMKGVKPRMGRLLMDLPAGRYRTKEYVQKMLIDLYDSDSPEELASMEPYVNSSQMVFGSNYPFN